MTALWYSCCRCKGHMHGKVNFDEPKSFFPTSVPRKPYVPRSTHDREALRDCIRKKCGSGSGSLVPGTPAVSTPSSLF
eukprot:scaffold7070_cov260-Pinguiococcus_pyrenoidosus.AAC.2